MKRATTITVLQSMCVVLTCALVGMSLVKVGGGATEDYWLMALGGAGVGLVGVAVGIIAHAPTRSLEQRRAPRQLIGLRIATLSFIVAILGWLVAVFVYGPLGFGLVVVGILGGVAGIIIHNINRFRAVNRPGIPGDSIS